MRRCSMTQRTLKAINDHGNNVILATEGDVDNARELARRRYVVANLEDTCCERYFVPDASSVVHTTATMTGTRSSSTTTRPTRAP